MSNESLQISPVIKDYLLSRGYSENFTVSSIAGAGSGRQYFRISEGSRSCVLQVCAEVNDDFRHFVDYSKTFRDFGLPVTRVYCVDESSCQVLQEDLGKRNLLDEVSPVSPGVRSGNERIIYPTVIDALVKWQEASQSIFSSHTELWIRRFDFAALKWETDYFTDNFLKAHCGIAEIPQSVMNFYSLLAVSVDAQPKVLMHRDFQSQNIMVRPNSEIAFVDFQGARRGSAFYDIASLLWDPYVCLPLSMIKDFRKRKYISNVISQDLFKNVKNSQVLHEFPFKDEQNHTNGIIDCLLLKDDEVDIIDFKLKHLDDDKYVLQLHTYCDYIKQITDLPIKMYLIGAITGEVKEIE